MKYYDTILGDTGGGAGYDSWTPTEKAWFALHREKEDRRRERNKKIFTWPVKLLLTILITVLIIALILAFIWLIARYAEWIGIITAILIGGSILFSLGHWVWIQLDEYFSK